MDGALSFRVCGDVLSHLASKTLGPEGGGLSHLAALPNNLSLTLRAFAQSNPSRWRSQQKAHHQPPARLRKGTIGDKSVCCFKEFPPERGGDENRSGDRMGRFSGLEGEMH